MKSLGRRVRNSLECAGQAALWPIAAWRDQCSLKASYDCGVKPRPGKAAPWRDGPKRCQATALQGVEWRSFGYQHAGGTPAIPGFSCVLVLKWGVVGARVYDRATAS
jgi:hypothetical protein